MRIESLKFLEEYINSDSPSGHESEGQKVWLNYIRPYINEYFVDSYGSVAAIINPGQKYKVVIEAHADEVAFYVNYISKDGYIYVTKIGGSDPVIAPSKMVRIHTERGIVKGVFGWPATHVREPQQNKPSIENIFIETGCSSREEVLNLGIDVGCPVTFDDIFKILNDSIISGPALDNKVGGFIIAEVARRLKEEYKKALPYSLYIANSVQEETGKRGAFALANAIKPDVALITDVTHDTQAPMYDKKQYGDISAGKGPVLEYAPTVQKNLLKMLMDVAVNNKIPFQKKVGAKGTGTDADSFAFSNTGIPTALIALPLKYMHTTAESVHIEDVENAIELIYRFLIQLPSGHNFNYFN